jgi:hypothetical protein
MTEPYIISIAKLAISGQKGGWREKTMVLVALLILLPAVCRSSEYVL